MEKITISVLGNPAETVLGGLSALGGGMNLLTAKTVEDLGPEASTTKILFNWTGSQDEVIKLMAVAPDLEWIHSRYAGLDKLLFPELIASPVPLTNGSGVFSQSLGEFIIAGILYFAKDLVRMKKAQAEKRWEVFDVREIRNRTLGIVGYGDIGRAIASRAQALGMTVLGHRRLTEWREGDQFVAKIYASDQLHEMLPLCDFVAVAAPLTPSTFHMMSTAEFNAMKPEAIVMNVGRGPVIDEAAMVAALQAGTIAGACLDVFEVEPLPPDSPLWDMENVLISAHTADHTQDWLDDAVRFFVEQYGRWTRGETLKNVVDKHAGY